MYYLTNFDYNTPLGYALIITSIVVISIMAIALTVLIIWIIKELF